MSWNLNTQELGQEHQSGLEKNSLGMPEQGVELHADMQEHQAEATRSQTAASSNNERVYLNVPFKQKEEAKALGAQWDRQKRSWYVPAATDTAAFAKWLKKEETVQTPQKEASEQRRDPQRRLFGCSLSGAEGGEDGRGKMGQHRPKLVCRATGRHGTVEKMASGKCEERTASRDDSP